MMRKLHRMLAGVGFMLALLPMVAAAQQGTTVSGRVTSESNIPIPGATVAIPSLAVGTYTNRDGRYSFVVPANRVNGQTVPLGARRIGHTPITVSVTFSRPPVTRDMP